MWTRCFSIPGLLVYPLNRITFYPVGIIVVPLFHRGTLLKSGIPLFQKKIAMHTHNFVETYQGLVGYGADRETDENTIIYYLQKFSDDKFMALITKRMTDAEMLELFNLINRLLKNHLTEAEYHSLFLKDEHGT
jgi:hypothetical protein